MDVVSFDHFVTSSACQLTNYLRFASYEDSLFRVRRVGLQVQTAWRLTSFESFVCAEHTIDRSAHLFQNKSRRHATHHFELIRLTWTNFESIGLHSFDGDFNHVSYLHDRDAFHIFKIKVTQEFGLCRWRC